MRRPGPPDTLAAKPAADPQDAGDDDPGGLRRKPSPTHDANDTEIRAGDDAKDDDPLPP